MKPHMHSLMCSLDSGANISWDGTFKIAKQCSGVAKCAMFVMGELGHILAHAFVPSENASTLLPLWTA